MQVSTNWSQFTPENNAWTMRVVKDMKPRRHEEDHLAMFRDILYEYVHNYTGMKLSQDEKTALMQNFKYRVVGRKQYVLQEGDVCHYLTFVLCGSLRMFSVNERGQECIVSFNVENTWATDRESVGLQKSTQYNIQALEDTHILQVTSCQLNTLSLTIPAIREMLRRQHAESIIATQKRIHAALRLSAEERYLDMLTSNPEYEQRFTQAMVASYLGITPETLSRQRKHSCLFTK